MTSRQDCAKRTKGTVHVLACLLVLSFVLSGCEWRARLAAEKKRNAARTSIANLGRLEGENFTCSDFEGDASLMHLFIDAGIPDVKVNGDPLLILALKRNHRSLFDDALAAGADPDRRQSEYDMTALMWAALRSDESAVRALLSKHSNPNLHDAYGWTPLMWAVQRGNRRITEVLLIARSGVDAEAVGGWTPMRIATARRQPEIQQLLRDFGAENDVDDPTEPLVAGGLVITPGNLDFGEVGLNESPTIPLRVELIKGVPPSTLAVWYSNGLLVEASSLDVNWSAYFGGGTMYLAQAAGRMFNIRLCDSAKEATIKSTVFLQLDGEKIVPVPVSARIRDKAQDKAFERETAGVHLTMATTVLWDAINRHDLRTVEWALRSGAEVRFEAPAPLRQRLMQTPLTRAVEERQAEILKALINAGADVNQAVGGKRPLELSAGAGNEVQQILLQAGAR